MSSRMELVLTRDDDGMPVLSSPEVGEFTAAVPRGRALTPGMVAGVIHQLGRAIELVVPPEAHGTVTSEPPGQLMHPVGFGDVLYRLDPAGLAGAPAGVGSTAVDGGSDGSALAVRAAQPGRVWRSPSPGEAPFCAEGDLLEEGSALCMIEVMKTFSTVPYRAANGLPPRARVLRWLVDDGADVDQGAPLVHIEPA